LFPNYHVTRLRTAGTTKALRTSQTHETHCDVRLSPQRPISIKLTRAPVAITPWKPKGALVDSGSAERAFPTRQDFTAFRRNPHRSILTRYSGDPELSTNGRSSERDHADGAREAIEARERNRASQVSIACDINHHVPAAVRFGLPRRVVTWFPRERIWGFPELRGMHVGSRCGNPRRGDPANRRFEPRRVAWNDSDV